jgi:hypothetical protein
MASQADIHSSTDNHAHARKFDGETELRATDNLDAALTQAEGMLDLMLEAYAAVDMHSEQRPAQLFTDDNLVVQMTAIIRSVQKAQESARVLDEYRRARE